MTALNEERLARKVFDLEVAKWKSEGAPPRELLVRTSNALWNHVRDTFVQAGESPARTSNALFQARLRGLPIDGAPVYTVSTVLDEERIVRKVFDLEVAQWKSEGAPLRELPVRTSRALWNADKNAREVPPDSATTMNADNEARKQLDELDNEARKQLSYHIADHLIASCLDRLEDPKLWCKGCGLFFLVSFLVIAAAMLYGTLTYPR